MTRPAIERILAKVVVADDGCHLFTGALSGAGYGVVGRGTRADGLGYTHRLVYEHVKGTIADGLHIDHLCRNRACCNPDHLEAVTQAENNRRQQADLRVIRTHCGRGHEWNDENTRHSGRQRYCRACRRIASQRKSA